MGIVCSTTSMHRSVGYSKMHPIQSQKTKKVSKLIKSKSIAVTTYIPREESRLSQLVFKASTKPVPSFCEPKHSALIFLRHTAIFLKSIERPCWSGYMSNVCVVKYLGKLTVNLLPIIDLDPSNMSCIYSTINFVTDQAKRLNIGKPALSFDQTLWLKATEIINAKSIKIATILGGFHLMMSVLGSIGTSMKGSGISEPPQNACRKKSCRTNDEWQSCNKAIGGHFFTSSVLFTKVLNPVSPALFGQNNTQPDNDIYQNNVRDVSIDMTISIEIVPRKKLMKTQNR